MDYSTDRPFSELDLNDLKYRPAIITHSGKYFDLANPDPAMVDIEDIAYALGQLRRFTGHANYTIAEHSLWVSYVVPPQYALEGLMHDAAEAYVGDISAPLKGLVPGFKAVEQRIERAVADRFKLQILDDPEIKRAVKVADLRAVAAERAALFPKDSRVWTSDIVVDVELPPDVYLPRIPHVPKTIQWPGWQAQMFLHRYCVLSSPEYTIDREIATRRFIQGLNR